MAEEPVLAARAEVETAAFPLDATMNSFAPVRIA